MNVKLRVWRQKDPQSAGRFVGYEAKDINPNMSFLEMLDVVNEDLTKRGEEPIAFDHDCREGICGMCSCVINGEPHGPECKVATCQTYMRSFHDGETITVEPFRAKAFPLIKDLVWIVPHSTGSSRRAGLFPSRPAPRPTATRSSFRNRMLTWRWMPPPASAVARVLPLVRTRARCCLSQPKFRI